MSGIDVNSNTTPITKQPVELVTADQWAEMSIPDLYDQLRILQNRYYTAVDMRKGTIAEQIQRGIKHIESIIAAKQEESERRGMYEVR